MADEEGLDDGPKDPDEEGQEQEPRRVRPLFRFRRDKNKGEEAEPQPEEPTEEVEEEAPDDEAYPARVRPVRVVKFVPDSDQPMSPEDGEEAPSEDAEVIGEDEEAPFAFTEEFSADQAHFEEAEDIGDEDTPFAEVDMIEEEEAPFAEADIGEEEETTFERTGDGVEEETPFSEAEVIDEGEQEAPFEEAEVVDKEEEPPFAEAEVIDEGEEEPAFVEAEVVDEVEEPPFAEAEVVDVGEREAPFAEAEVVDEEEAPFTAEEATGAGVAFTEVVEEEQPFIVAEEGNDVPEVPFAVIEEVEREEVVDEGISAEEEAEMSEDLDFRQEETPVKFERKEPGFDEGPGSSPEPAYGGGIPAVPLTTTEPGHEEKPHYHKYLKPDEDLVSRPQARGRPTGFDQDLESEAGEIDIGIDLIDPNERKRKKVPKKSGDGTTQPKKGTIGGHDSDGEVGTRELGVDIGVDYSKRRKRRL